MVFHGVANADDRWREDRAKKADRDSAKPDGSGLVRDRLLGGSPNCTFGSRRQGSLHAMQAMHADIARRGITAVYHLGDLVG